MTQNPGSSALMNGIQEIESPAASVCLMIFHLVVFRPCREGLLSDNCKSQVKVRVRVRLR